jgi:hypothetical protein
MVETGFGADCDADFPKTGDGSADVRRAALRVRRNHVAVPL